MYIASWRKCSAGKLFAINMCLIFSTIHRVSQSTWAHPRTSVRRSPDHLQDRVVSEGRSLLLSYPLRTQVAITLTPLILDLKTVVVVSPLVLYHLLIILLLHKNRYQRLKW